MEEDIHFTPIVVIVWTEYPDNISYNYLYLIKH